MTNPPDPHGKPDSVFKLTRSRDKSVIAGVCGGLARATSTDPILFRVILAVLALFGGVGVLLYLVAWLLLPADGETASPAGALLGRGNSTTGVALTVVLAGAAILLLSWIPVRTFPANAVLLATLTLATYLLLRCRPDNAQAPPVTAGSTSPLTSQPLAPHGPFAQTPATGFSQAPPTTTAAVPTCGEPQRDIDSTEQVSRLKLSHLTLGIGCLVIAGMIITDIVASVNIPVAAYFATALAITAIGLLVGTWLGRARGLIALAVALSIGLGLSTAAAGVADRTIVWSPVTASELRPYYDAETGHATLDLRQLRYDSTTTNSTDAPQQVRVRLGAGKLTVRLPEDVPSTISAHVMVGKLNLLGKRSDGAGLADQRVKNSDDSGADLALDLNVGAGRLEVTQ